jgi:DnaJ-class molecular chaperone
MTFPLHPPFSPSQRYESLGLDETCTASQVKKAYFKLSLKLHPDKGGNVTDFKRITMAYTNLMEFKEVEKEENDK